MGGRDIPNVVPVPHREMRVMSGAFQNNRNQSAQLKSQYYQGQFFTQSSFLTSIINPDAPFLQNTLNNDIYWDNNLLNLMLFLNKIVYPHIFNL